MDRFDCQRCGVSFIATGWKRVHCAPCLKSMAQIERARLGARAHLDSNVVGTIGELQIATMLMQASWHVLKPISGTCPVDLVAIRANRVIRIEVKSFAGFGQPGARARRAEIDVIAWVNGDGLNFRQRTDAGWVSWDPFTDAEEIHGAAIARLDALVENEASTADVDVPVPSTTSERQRQNIRRA